METNIWAGGGGKVLCGGKGGMLFEGGRAVQGRDDWTMQPGARLNIRNTYNQVTFSFLGCFIVQHYVYSESIAGNLIFHLFEKTEREKTIQRLTVNNIRVCKLQFLSRYINVEQYCLLLGRSIPEGTTEKFMHKNMSIGEETFAF